MIFDLYCSHTTTWAVPRENQHYWLCVMYRSRSACAVDTFRLRRIKVKSNYSWNKKIHSRRTVSALVRQRVLVANPTKNQANLKFGATWVFANLNHFYFILLLIYIKIWLASIGWQLTILCEKLNCFCCCIL